MLYDASKRSTMRASRLLRPLTRRFSRGSRRREQALCAEKCVGLVFL